MNQVQHLRRPARRALSTTRDRALHQTLLIVLLSMAVVLSAVPSAVSSAADASTAGLTTQLGAYITSLSGPNTLSGAVLVAHHGTILLSKGYGMADRAHNIPNAPTTPYQVNGVSGSLAFLGVLWLEEHGRLSDKAPICRYLTGCPAAWQPITVHMVLAGTSALPGFDTNTPGRTIAQSLRLMQSLPLVGTPGSQAGYVGNGEGLILPLITEKVSGQPWGTFLQQHIFGPAGMTRSGQLTPASAPQSLARSYSGSTLTPDASAVSTTSSYFVAYASAPDIYAYDNALFGGKLVNAATMSRLFTPRVPAPAPTTGFTDVRYGYWWKTGQVAGHQVVYTVRNTTVNLRFVKDGVTIIVIGNDALNIVGDVAVHLAALVFGKAVAASPTHTAAPAGPPHVIAPAKAVLATYANTGGGWPFALTPGALWSPTASADGEYNYVTRVDTRTGRVVATITVSKLPNDSAQDSVVTANGQIWAIDHAAKAVVRIDPATNKVVAIVPIGMIASQLAIAGPTLWASGANVVRVDVRTQKIVSVITHVGHPYLDTAATPDAFWYISQDTLRVMRIDAATNKIVAAISAGPVPQTVFVGAGSVWVGDASGALVTRIDPRTNKVVAVISTDGYPGNRRPAIDDCACRYAVGDGSVWAIANSTTLVRIDPRTNRLVASLTLSDRLGSIAVSEGSIWISSDGANPTPTIYRVNPRAMQ